MFKKIFIILFIFIFNCNSMNLLNFSGFKTLLARQIKKIVPKGKEETEIRNKLNDIKLDSDVQTLVLDYLKADYPKYKLIKTISIENFNELYKKTSLKDKLYVNFIGQNIAILHDKCREMNFLERLQYSFEKNKYNFVIDNIYINFNLIFYVKDFNGNTIELPESEKQSLHDKIYCEKMCASKYYLVLSDRKSISCFSDDGKTHVDYGFERRLLRENYIFDGEINCPREITKNIIAFVKNKKSIIFMNIENGEVINEIIFDNTICDLSFSDNKKHLAVAFENGQIQIFEKQQFDLE